MNVICYLLPALAGLAFLALNDLVAVLDAFALIRFRLLQASQVRRNLADKLLIDALSVIWVCLASTVALIPLGSG